MNSFDLAKAIRKAICNRAAQVFSYTNWSDGFAVKEIRDIPSWVRGSGNFKPIDPNDFTVEQLKELGFGQWDEESNLFLIPLWMHPFLADEIDGGSISGERKVFKRDEIDNDERFGCLAYGVYKE